ncbi:hypothetical protein NQZ68_014222 [Dissostichus eleginoides]|nr:hypothetical protein NQZ68_014222 [Dissostichus eleginoides]
MGSAGSFNKTPQQRGRRRNRGEKQNLTALKEDLGQCSRCRYEIKTTTTQEEKKE